MAFSMLLGSQCFAQDYTEPLLLDMNLQIDVTEAVNNMYNFKFAAAEKEFNWLRYQYPDHPLPYFLLGLSQWWKIAPNQEIKKYDDDFFKYMDQAISVSEKIYDKNEDDMEASFFLAAAYAFKGRLHSERKNWRKAASAGKSSLKYLEISKKQMDLSPELLFGDALYNYYSVWIPENYPFLKPILMFFSKGDKDLGVKQLTEVSRNAFYTRTEAQFFLMRILALEEKKYNEALQISQYLAETFPDNSYFQRFYARVLYTMGRYHDTEPIALDIIAKIDSAQVGYDPVSGRYAAFFLGQIYDSKKDVENAKKYYQRAVEFGEMIGAEKSGYYLFSHIGLGKIAMQAEDKKTARSHFKKVRKQAKKKHAAHKEASRLLKALKG